MPSQQQTLEQERAARAWECIADVKPKDFKGKYRTIATKLPAHITTSGLGQTLAFLRAKSTPKPGKPPSAEQLAHASAYNHLSGWVLLYMHRKQIQQDALEKWLIEKNYETDAQSAKQYKWKYLLEWLLVQGSEVYRQATAEALAFLGWLKRFAEAELPEAEEV
ncbi:MAG: type III-B CRISPR module-associated protein Cmr5 [Chloroflexi bacterium]|nr:type III-B CRISPR module-associated protein Cmr5 [Chloroflexota bacterium]